MLTGSANALMFVAVAHGGLLSASIASRILFDGANLMQFKVEIATFAVVLFLPIPLSDRSLDEGGRGVGIVLEQLRRILAIVPEVEAAVERRGFFFPRALDERRGHLGNTELGIALIRDDMSGCRKIHLVQLVRRSLEHIDLARAEMVAGALIPIRLSAERVVREPALCDLLLPVFAWTTMFAAH